MAQHTTSDSRCVLFDDQSATRAAFDTNFDQKPFLFHHKLHEHPLLGFPALKVLAERIARAEKPRGFFRLSGDKLDNRWGTGEFQKALNEAFENIEQSKMRMKLSDVNSEPEYSALLADCTRELSELAGVDLNREYRHPRATLFITSPNEVTPFHVDSETNFLLQIYGTKVMYVFDQADRELLTWQELENYWHGDGHIRLRDGFQSRSIPFELKPGLGVHNPVHFPHWVQNGPSPSVSLSLGFTRRHDPEDVLFFNHFLRKLGVEPTPPGERKKLDVAKTVVVGGARSLKRLVKSA
ncbi:MAG TPA: hypothetical protein VN661_03365 [Candidatus Acidoferrales bacterium]|nr:hypothetical protein [Candidatus Acidoferrales bacterium]